MSVNIKKPGAVGSDSGRLELYGIRPETFEAIVDDLGGHLPPDSAYDEKVLRLDQPELEGIRWSTFEAILDDLGDHRGLRLAYDAGRLRFMSPSRRHEREKSLLGRIVEMFTFELRIPISTGGSVTLRRPDLEKAVEPDECYWIDREAAVRDEDSLDLAIQPPPDLAIEADVTHSSLSSLTIYAALGVPEVWRYEDGAILIYVLGPAGHYETRSESASLPGLTCAEMERFLRLRRSTDETSWMYTFRDWVRDEVAPKRRGTEAG